MGKLTITAFVSIDGVMQAPGGPDEDISGGFKHGGWLVPHADEGMGAAIMDIFPRASAFLLGRGTYDIFAASWPKVTDENDPVAVKLNGLPKHVASRSQTQFAWNNSTHIADVARDVAALKTRYDGELQVHGSPGLLQTLIEHDLIDEYNLFIFPVVLGAGKRLFGSGTMPGTMKLVSSTVTENGTIIAKYHRAGPLKTGEFDVDAQTGSMDIIERNKAGAGK
jgi:dihydrofolate reductase